MAKKDVQEETNGTMENNNTGFGINSDEALNGSTHLNEPVAEESALEKIKEALEKEIFEIHLPAEIIEKGKKSLSRMFELSK